MKRSFGLMALVFVGYTSSAFAVSYHGCKTKQQQDNANRTVSFYQMVNTWNISGLRALIPADFLLTFSCLPADAAFCTPDGTLPVRGQAAWDGLVAAVHLSATPSQKYPDVFIRYDVKEVTCIGTDTTVAQGHETGKVRGMASSFDTDFTETWKSERNANGSIGPQFHTVWSFQQDEVTDPVFAQILNPPAN